MAWTLSELDRIQDSQVGLFQAKRYLKTCKYPKPEDCPHDKCPELKPCCQMGVCPIAVKLCNNL